MSVARSRLVQQWCAPKAALYLLSPGQCFGTVHIDGLTSYPSSPGTDRAERAIAADTGRHRRDVTFAGQLVDMSHPMLHVGICAFLLASS
jgi:hypothetical protein